jgi:hypothetical protein
MFYNTICDKDNILAKYHSLRRTKWDARQRHTMNAIIEGSPLLILGGIIGEAEN